MSRPGVDISALEGVTVPASLVELDEETKYTFYAPVAVRSKAVRDKLRYVRVVFIDEISMVDEVLVRQLCTFIGDAIGSPGTNPFTNRTDALSRLIADEHT